MENDHNPFGFVPDTENEYYSQMLRTLMEFVPGGLVGIAHTDGKVLFASDAVFQMTGYSREELDVERQYNWFSKLVFPEDQQFVNDTVSEQLREKGRAELNFRMVKKDGSVMWVKEYAGSLQQSPWDPCFLCCILDDTELIQATREAEEARKQMENLMETIPGGVARLCLSDNHRIVLATEGYYALTGYTKEECEQPPIAENAMYFVVNEDLPKVAQAIEQLLRTNEPVSVEYRILRKDGTIAINTAYCSKADSVGDEVYIDAVFFDSTRLDRTERRLTSLINSIPGGVTRLHVNGDIYIDYANDGFYRLTGYTAQEFSAAPIENRYIGIIHPADREMVYNWVTSFVNSIRECPSLDYRIYTKSGELRWMRASASRVGGGLEGRSYAQCVIMDITESKQAEEQIAISAERHRIVAEQTQDVIFTWDMATGTASFSSIFESKFGYPPPDSTYEKIHEEDRHIIEEAVRKLREGEPYVAAEYRTKKADGSYIWCRSRMTAIFDAEHKSVQVVGVIIDIDDDKREAAKLRERADTDSLTGLLNRGTIQHQIEEHLGGCRSDDMHAFLLIDIDNFKWINDTFGHEKGDEVLAGFSTCLKNQFRSNDISGRLGGDEFIVFMDDVKAADFVMKKSQRLCELFCDTFPFEEYDHSVSISIGVAFSPEHGTTFGELYHNADKALYESKNNGRNRYTVYMPDDLRGEGKR